MSNVDQEYAEFDNGFGHWLAGFIAGEGSFNITKMCREKGLICRMIVQVRDDDAPIIEEMQKRTGLGYLFWRKDRPNGSKPAITWNVSKKADTIALVAILDRFPIRSRKADDYAIWREAVLEWAKAVSGTKFDWTRMNELRESLKDVRVYIEPDRNKVYAPSK